MSKVKQRVTVLMALVLALSLSFFVYISPTSAWLYQSAESTGTFTFGNFDNTSPVYDPTNQPQAERYSQSLYGLQLKAATRFADADELLFDDCVHVVHVTTTNQGNVDSFLTVDVSSESSDVLDGPTREHLNKGLRYCFFSMPANSAPTSYKAAVQSAICSADIGSSRLQTVNGYSAYATDAAYENYNASAKAALDANNSLLRVVPANTTMELYVVFWVEYGELLDYYNGAGGDDHSSSVFNKANRTILNLTEDYGVTVSFYATQEDYLITPSTLSITNRFSDNNASGQTRFRLRFTNPETNQTTNFVGMYYLVNSNGTRTEVTVRAEDQGMISVGHNQTVQVPAETRQGYSFTIRDVEMPSGYTGFTISGGVIQNGDIAYGDVSPVGNDVTILCTASGS